VLRVRRRKTAFPHRLKNPAALREFAVQELRVHTGKQENAPSRL
jgi:hypothetical protein